MDRSPPSEGDAGRPDRERRTRVLFVGGAGKSGSTLLGVLLGQLDGLFNVGELVLFWEAALDERSRCGCGVPLRRCKFWSRVIADLHEAAVDIPRMAALTTRLDTTRHLGRVLTRRLRPGIAGEWRELVAGTVRLYEAVSRHCECPCVVDASKLPTHVLLLRELPRTDIRLLHLVRDGRAVAYSWERKRRRRRSSTEGIRGLRGHRSAAGDLAIWAFQNFVIDLLGRRVGARTMLRYEDLATAPESALRRALTALEPEVEHPAGSTGTIALGPTHAIAGNDTVRFAEPGTVVALDEAWRRELSPATIRAWSLFAFPALRRFGYPVW